MPERARATALPVTRNSTTLAKRQPNAQSALSPLQSPSAVPTRSGGSLQFHSACQHNNIETSPRRLLGLRFAYATEFGLCRQECRGDYPLATELVRQVRRLTT
jgi:hypothetical protein